MSDLERRAHELAMAYAHYVLVSRETSDPDIWSTENPTGFFVAYEEGFADFLNLLPTLKEKYNYLLDD